MILRLNSSVKLMSASSAYNLSEDIIFPAKSFINIKVLGQYIEDSKSLIHVNRVALLP